MTWFTAKVNSASGNVENYSEPTSKVVCVGRNYVEHAKELNNPVPKRPLLFIKPNTSLIDLSSGITLPAGETNCHHELEVAVLIGSRLTKAKESDVCAGIVGLGLALDLTLRDEQTALKQKGQPWERAKAFDGSCPITAFLPWEGEQALNDIAFSMNKNGEVAQAGNTADMLFPIVPLIMEISQHFTLLPGDIVLTGTPEGVGPLSAGDQLDLALLGQPWENTTVS